jgi:hypothetical protein
MITGKNNRKLPTPKPDISILICGTPINNGPMTLQARNTPPIIINNLFGNSFRKNNSIDGENKNKTLKTFSFKDRDKRQRAYIDSTKSEINSKKNKKINVRNTNSE